MLPNPRVSRFVNSHHLAFSAFFAFHDLVATIYREKTGKTIGRLPGTPPAAHCCMDLRSA